MPVASTGPPVVPRGAGGRGLSGARAWQAGETMGMSRVVAYFTGGSALGFPRKRE